MDTNPTPQPSVWPPLAGSAISTGAALFYIAAERPTIAAVYGAIAMTVPPRRSAATRPVTDTATYEGLRARYRDLDARLDELIAAREPRSYADWTAEMRTVASELDETHAAMRVVQPWTVFTTCTGSATVAVEAGEDVAVAAFAAHLGSDPFSRCGQCGDTNWQLAENPAPEGADEIIDAAAVALLTDGD